VFQDCAGVILYSAEAATQMALDAIQILGLWLQRFVYLVFKDSRLVTGNVGWLFVTVVT